MLDKVTISRAAELTGYTQSAIRSKIECGVWPEKVVWFRAPDNRILISLRGYEEWAEGRACASLVPTPSKSIFAGTEGSGRVSVFRQRKRISATAKHGSEG